MSKIKLLLLLFILSSICAFGETKISFQKISHIDGTFGDVAVFEDKLYTISDTFLKIYNISDPSSVALLTNYDTKREAKKIDIYSNYAYLADGKGGALFLNIADIDDIYVKLSYNNKEHQNWGVVVKDNISYEADGTKGINIVDIADPYNPFIVSSFSKLSDARDVDIKDDFLYVADGKEGLKILNVSDLKSPQMVKTFDTDGFASSIKIKENIAFIADTNSLVTIDISNPSNPIKIPNSYPKGEDIIGVDIKDDYLYLVNKDNGIEILKISGIINQTLKKNIEPFVKLLYKKILDREADEEGLNFWALKIQNGMSAAKAAKNFFDSEEFQKLSLSNEDFIKKAYETLLNRQPDPSGLAYWKKQMDEGVTKEEIFYGFALSKEFENLATKIYKVTPFDQQDKLEAFVSRFYNFVLNRQTDPQGRAFWVNALISGEKNASDIALGFFNSKEFKERSLNNEEFIKIVYKTLLNRDADENGLKFWNLKLQNKSHLDIIKGFLLQDEFKKISLEYGLS